MNRDCESYEPMMADALGGELSESDRPAFEAHLDACERCRRDYHSAAGLLGELRAHLETPAESNAPITEARGGTRSFKPAVLLRYAAAIVLAFSAGYLWNRPATGAPTHTQATGTSGGGAISVRERLVLAHRANPDASDFAKSLRAVIGVQPGG